MARRLLEAPQLEDLPPLETVRPRLIKGTSRAEKGTLTLSSSGSRSLIRI
jgi:hypothetical protein